MGSYGSVRAASMLSGGEPILEYGDGDGDGDEAVVDATSATFVSLAASPPAAESTPPVTPAKDARKDAGEKTMSPSIITPIPSPGSGSAAPANKPAAVDGAESTAAVRGREDDLAPTSYFAPALPVGNDDSGGENDVGPVLVPVPTAPAAPNPAAPTVVVPPGGVLFEDNTAAAAAGNGVVGSGSDDDGRRSEPTPLIRNNSVTVGGVVYGAGPGTGLEILSRSFSNASVVKSDGGPLLGGVGATIVGAAAGRGASPFSGAARAFAPFAVEKDPASAPQVSAGMDAVAAVFADGGVANTPPSKYAAAATAAVDAGASANGVEPPTPYGFASPATPAPMVSKSLVVGAAGLAAPPVLQLGSPRHNDDKYTADAV